MHEIAICQSIIEMVEEEFPEIQWESIREIHLKIGMLTCIQPENLAQVYQLMTYDSKLQSSMIKVELLNTISKCSNCSHQFEVKYNVFICPLCSSSDQEIVQGNELLVDKILIETSLYEEMDS